MARPYGASFAAGGTYLINQGGIQWVHTFSQNLVNEFRAGTDIEYVKNLPRGFYGSSFTAACA